MNNEEESTTSTKHRGLWQSYTSMSLTVLVLGIVIATMLVRFVFASNPQRLSGDEYLVYIGTDPLLIDNFANAGLPERWEQIERYSVGGRIFWMLGHYLWAFLLKCDGDGAWVLSVLWSMIALASLGGAARRLYGSRGMLLTLLFVSLSPFFFEYSIRIIGTIQSTMWLCVALWSFSSPKWSLKSWLFGGLCLGFSFCTHYGSGPAIVGIAVCLGLSVLMYLVRGDGSVFTRIWRGLLGPIVGACASVLPLLLLESWALISGGSFIDRHFHHEVLDNVSHLGPHGLWLRELFELEPMLLFFLLIAMAQTMRQTRWRPTQFTFLFWGAILGFAYLLLTATDGQWLLKLIDPAAEEIDKKIWLGLIGAIIVVALLSRLAETYSRGITSTFYLGLTSTIMVGLVAGGMQEAFPRVWVSYIFFTALAAIVIFTKVLDPPRAAETFISGQDSPPSDFAPLNRRAILPALLVLGIVYTYWRQVSGMPRLVFAAWPLMTLCLTGLLMHLFHRNFGHLMRLFAIAGICVFIVVAGAMAFDKGRWQRGNYYERYHPYMTSMSYFYGMLLNDRIPTLTERVGDRFDLIGPPTNLYPATAYEEETFKPRSLDDKLAALGLKDQLSGLQLTFSELYYETVKLEANPYPPPGSPMFEETLHVTSPNLTSIELKRNKHRGIAISFPPIANDTPDESQVITYNAFAHLEAKPGVPSKAGYEFAAIGGKVPHGTTIEMRLTSDGDILAEQPVQITSRFTGFSTTIGDLTPNSNEQQLHIELKLNVPANSYCPPVTFYVRRMFLTPIQQ